MGHGTGKAEGLQTLQLQHWVRAVKAGGAPLIRDADNDVITELKLPLARSTSSLGREVLTRQQVDHLHSRPGRGESAVANSHRS